MFEHSIRVPRHFKISADIFKKIKTEGGSLKSLLYDNKLRHFRTNVLFALITETIKHDEEIDKIFESCSLLTNEPRLNPWLAKILTTELLFGKKILPGKSTPEKTILSYKEQFEKYTTDHQDVVKPKVANRPRYVRINTNLLTVSDAIGAFQEEGYRFVRCTSGSYEDYLNQIRGLSEYDFTQDYHLKTMFVFPAGTKFHNHDLYLESKIILQDKATAMAVHLLAPPPGSVVMDMCAAPGMKTTQLAGFIRNEGKIYAIERDEGRYKTLCEFVEGTGSKCVQTVNKDVLEIKRGDYDDVEYVLLDPSCSGSGMDHHIYDYTQEARLAKLTSLQEKFLKHAMNAFPKAKRIVYSTCSLRSEENERVVTNVVKNSRTKWRVQDVKELLKGQWNNIGSGMYGSMGARCMYSRPESDLTTGFFLAVLDRDQKELERILNNETGLVDGEIKANEKKHHGSDDNTEINACKKRKNKDVKEVAIDEIQNEDPIENEEISKKKKKKKEKCYDHDNEDVNDNTNASIFIESINDQEMFQKDHEANLEDVSKKKKDKRKLQDTTDSNLDESTITMQDGEVKKKEKKKLKTSNKEDNETKHVEELQLVADVDESSRKKKKKKSQDVTHSKEVESKLNFENVENEIDDMPKKKKKKKREVITAEGESDN